VGEVFAGRYELIVPIAEGGMGTVWEVLDRNDNQVKAAKILRQSDAASLLRFVREQSMRIDHRHVVTPQSWAGMDDRVLFTMPLVRGGSVASLLGDFGALPLRWVGTLLDQTLQALEAVHAAGIVHRDVKPGNLLLEPTGRDQPHLRLTDFGIAAPMDEPRMTRASMAIGSPGYMPPEQWHGADPDPRQDVYAVGLVGLEMLTGVRPEVERAPIDLDALPEPRELARDLVSVLERAASPDPAGRHASATELRLDLARLDLVNQTMAADDDVEVFDHFPASAHAPADRTPTRRGTPYTAPESTDRYAAATVLGAAPATAVQPASLSRMNSSGRSMVPGLILLIVGVVALVLALSIALAT
jgi:serine/threonine protein kinase